MKTYTIIIADDYPENVQVIVDILKKTDLPHKIIRAVNGTVLCEMSIKRIPDLIITDWEMPEMNGIEAIRYLKTIEATKDIPIIICTGVMTTSENLKVALDSGAVDYIRKPVDEIELQARVHSMLKLSNSYQTIKEQNLLLEEQKENIESQRNELELANATKDKFFSIIAHDLRNPFVTIVGFSNLILKQLEENDVEKSIKYAQMLSQSSNIAFSLLENLLSWSRSQTGSMKYNPENMNLGELIRNNFNLLSNTAESKGVMLISLFNEDLNLFADKDMIETILRNLISNAIKFSRRDDQITISVEVDQEKVTVHVQDTGVGINEKNISKLFSVEHKVQTKGTDNELGTGLGLILCKEFIDWHKGKIWVESEINIGSIFSFTIPKFDFQNQS